MSTLAFRLWLAGLYLAGVALLSLQPIRGVLHPAFQGLMPDRGGDEMHYIVRLQEGLLHPFGNTSNGIIGGLPAPLGVQPAGLEQLVGLAFGWTGMRGPVVAVLVSILLAPLTIVFTAFLAEQLGIPRKWTLVVGISYFLLLLGPLRRVVHQSWSLPLTVVALCLITAWWRQPTLQQAMGAGVILGILPYAYFWSWTFTWAAAVFLLLANIVLKGWASSHWRRSALVLGIIAVLVASPAFVRMVEIAAHPRVREVALRSSVVFARELESPLRSLVLLILVASVVAFAWRRKDHSLLPIVAMLLALLLTVHQQLLHGRVLSYWTHEYPYVCLASLLVVARLLRQRLLSVEYVLAMGSASLFLLGAVTDYSARLAVLHPPADAAFQLQHLAPVMERMSGDGRVDTVLTDQQTSLVVAANTDDDVVFTQHLRHVLIPTREYAERYCLSEALTEGAIDDRYVADTLHELSSAGRAEAARLHAERLRVNREACDWVQAHLQEAMEKYRVSVILWNERLKPDWALPSPFQQEAQGEGWSLWRRKM